jgi:predicted Zn-dependent protease
MIEAFENMLTQGRDDALLRFSLGNAYLQQNRPLQAIEHLRAALRHDPDYSAAWKQLGNALTAAERPDEALAAYDQGVRVAQQKGDQQAAKEMQVFARRLRKAHGHHSDPG